ncbi:alpha/beta fold hydrolase [Actinophytocola sp.]|uniref:alpha/beta fold hydrolase n=1 Tax=Actinophytocola sp. TaxID=1872138 RepID=UPI003D6A9DDA
MPTFPAPDQVSLHYDVHGDGPPLVAIAGGAACHPSYLGDLAGLPRRLIVPHLRGVGLSPAPDEPEKGAYWRQAADIDALREHLGLERLVLTGHSAGTRLAISYAAQYPERIERLLLITPPLEPPGYLVDVPSDADALIEARRVEPEFSAALAAREAGPDLSDEETSAAKFNEWQRACAPFGYAAWTAVEQDHARTMHYYLPAARAYFSVDPPADLAERLSAVRAPVLVIGGAQDCTTGIAPVMTLARLFPAGDVVMLDRCGHFPWVERPAEFRQAAETFLG